MSDVMTVAEHAETHRTDAAPRLVRAEEADARPLLLRAEEAAHLLNVGRSTVFQMLADGTLPAVRFGRSVRVRRSDIDALIEARVSGAA